MTERWIYSRSEKKFYKIPHYSKEEVARMRRISKAQAKRGEFGLILDSPQAIKAFKDEDKEEVWCTMLITQF